MSVHLQETKRVVFAGAFLFQSTCETPSPGGHSDRPQVFYVPTAALQCVVSGDSLKPHSRGSLQKKNKLISGLQLSRHCSSVVGRSGQPDAETTCLCYREKNGVHSLLENVTWNISSTFSVSCKENTKLWCLKHSP